MTAKEMFEKLDFKLDDCSNFKGDACCLNYQKIKDYKIIEEITFYLKGAGLQHPQYRLGFNNKEYLTYEELQAINKQIEELGWNDENTKQ